MHITNNCTITSVGRVIIILQLDFLCIWKVLAFFRLNFVTSFTDWQNNT